VEFRYAYDENRNKTLEGDRDDQGWSFTYDNTLRLATHSMRDGNTFTFSDFDDRNEPRSITFPQMNVVLDYDRQGRLLSRNSSYLGWSRSESYTYDALDRVTSTAFDGGRLTNQYNLLGPLRETRFEAGNQAYTLQYGIRADGIRTNLAYPSAATAGGRVFEQRDIAGRLVAVQPESTEPVVTATSYAAAALIGRQTFGTNLFDCENEFDGRQRLFHRKYTRRADGKVLAEIRYAFDSNNNVIAKQSLQCGGRADFFTYDVDDRLIRADIGARPAIGGETPRSLTGFSTPPNVNPPQAAWAPGFFARRYAYDGELLDRLAGSTTINPDGLPLPPFATTIGSFDASLHAGTADGFARGRDPMGNTTNTVLHVRLPGSTDPAAVPALLQYDGKGQLVRIVRTDGVTIDYQYLPSGLCFNRTVAGPANRCVPSDRVFIWDGARLIEEYDVTPSIRTLRARYYYTVSDVPVAADIADAGGILRRHYFLMDAQGSLLATVDAAGGFVERYSYDAWGQPEIEPADTQAPVVRRIVSATDGFVIEFSERVLPPLLTPPGSTNRELITTFGPLADRIVVQQAGAPLPGNLVFEESRAGFPFGTVVRFQPAGPISGNLTLRLESGAVNDEWNNPVAAASINFTHNPAPGIPLFSNLVTTSPVAAGRTAFDQPFLFHGQYFDFEAGLVYLRARFYDPFLGVFLQRDPAGYVDSVNPYAGFANNPQSLRDPSGNLVFVPIIAAVGAAIGGAIAGFLEYQEQEQPEFNKEVVAAAVGGAVAGAFAGFTAGGSLLVEGLALGAIGAVAGGASEVYLADKTYSPELALKDAASGALGGVAGAVGGRILGGVAKRVLGSYDRLPGGIMDAVSSGRPTPRAPTPAAAAVQTVERTEILQRVERTEVIHRDALVLERESARLRQETADFMRESVGFVNRERVDTLRGSSGKPVEGLFNSAKEVAHQRAVKPSIKYSMAKGRMEGANTIAHEAFHARVEMGLVRNPFGKGHIMGNPRALLWEEVMANKQGFAWEMQMQRRAGEKFTPDLQDYLRGGDEWLVRELAGRYGVSMYHARQIMGHLKP
jgi:RHS repeat-associated protein